MAYGTSNMFGAFTAAGAVVMTLGAAPPIVPAPRPDGSVASVAARPQLINTESWIMGGSGLPIPPPSYLENVSERYIDPENPLFAGQPTFDVDKTNPLFTPEGLYPFTAVKNLELDPSVDQGVSILNSTIHDQLAADPNNHLVVLGYSQSATINSLVMRDLLALPPGEQPSTDQLSFVLLGDPSNPDGGLLSRFDLTTLGQRLPQLTIPSLGVTFSGATPADTPWETAIYTQEYDGFADFPKYPLNALADLNALLGILFVHGKYPTLSAEHIGEAIPLNTSADYAGHTEYFMIPTQTLPLLQPLLSMPGLGKPLYDLLEPVTRILVNLGYGSIDNGWDDGPADVSTPFGLFPDMNWNDVFTALGQGAEKGWNDFVDDLGNPALADPTGGAGEAAGLTDIVNGLTGAFSSLYAALLPTADIATALGATLPLYAFDLFTHYLEEGELLNAIGMPLAALTGLGIMAGGFELIAIENALGDAKADLDGLFS